ncbi:MAG: hypothetical protein Q9174_007162 [Haloplaca sp. 1 TL-2023]
MRAESVNGRGAEAPGRPPVIEMNRATRERGHPIATSEFSKKRVRARRRRGLRRTWAYRSQKEALRRQSRPKAVTGSRTFPQVRQFLTLTIGQQPTDPSIAQPFITSGGDFRLLFNQIPTGRQRRPTAKGQIVKETASRPHPSRQRVGSIGRRVTAYRLCECGTKFKGNPWDGGRSSAARAS